MHWQETEKCLIIIGVELYCISEYLLGVSILPLLETSLPGLFCVLVCFGDVAAVSCGGAVYTLLLTCLKALLSALLFPNCNLRYSATVFLLNTHLILEKVYDSKVHIVCTLRICFASDPMASPEGGK